MRDMPTDDDPLARARERVAALRASLEASEGRPVRLIETHISWVLLTDALAYKLKKPVRLPFLDFSTLALRRLYCAEELRVNRRLASSLYLDVVDVRDGPNGPLFDGSGPVVEVALRMRRFPDGALWSEQLQAGTLAPHHVDAMAQRLADFHCDAEIAPPDSAFGSAAIQQRITAGLISATDAWLATATAPQARAWPALRAWLNEQLATLAPLSETRRRAGRVRECHGDLHLANVLQLDGAAAAFDGIEFDAELRWIDVLDDIAFLAMDLLAQGGRRLGWRFVNAYLEASGDFDGLPLLRFFMVRRALVRAQAAALRAGQGAHAQANDAARGYLALAVTLSTDADARLAITHGLPGSGKSFVSQGVIEEAGAIRVRSDVERKRLFGLGALQSSDGLIPGGIYDPATTARTYARVREVATLALQSGWPVLVDAAFLRRAERQQFVDLARALGAPFTIFDCQAPLPLLRERIARRRAQGGDASEADEVVLERLSAAAEPLDRIECESAVVVDAAQPADPATLARVWRAQR